MASALVLAAVVVLAVGVLLILEFKPPSVTCSTPDTAACKNTGTWISDDWGQDLVFAERLPARLVAVDVRPSPPEWKKLAGYREGDWAALLTMAGREARAGRVLLQL